MVFEGVTFVGVGFSLGDSDLDFDLAVVPVHPEANEGAAFL